MLRFTIRDVLWLTVIVAMGLGWWRNHLRMARLETESRRWQLRAEFMRDEVNGIKIEGKWIFPWRYDFQPERDDAEMRGRNADGECIAKKLPVQWRPEWAELK